MRKNANIGGTIINKKSMRTLFLMFSLVKPWMKKRSKIKMLKGNMTAFSFAPTERRPEKTHMKKKRPFRDRPCETRALRKKYMAII